MYLKPAHDPVVLLVLVPNGSSEHTPFTPDVVTKGISIDLFEIPPWSGQRLQNAFICMNKAMGSVIKTDLPMFPETAK